MHIGVFALFTTGTIAVTDLARDLEERGIESLAVGEHTHTPTASEVDGYHSQAVIDATRDSPSPFVVLAAAAAVTNRLRLGTAVCLPGQHDPLVFAKEVATLDRISGGRVFLGCGYGWNKAEMLNHGVDPQWRRSNFRERVAAAKALWAQDIAAFSGDYVSFTPSWSLPKPVQPSGPKVLIGAPARPQTFRDMIELGNGWMPAARFTDDQLVDDLAQFRRAIEDSGRAREDFSVTMLDTRAGVEPYPPAEFVDRCVSADQLLRWRHMDIERAIIGLPVHDRATTLPMVDHIAGLIRAIT